MCTSWKEPQRQTWNHDNLPHMIMTLQHWKIKHAYLSKMKWVFARTGRLTHNTRIQTKTSCSTHECLVHKTIHTTSVWYLLKSMLLIYDSKVNPRKKKGERDRLVKKFHCRVCEVCVLNLCSDRSNTGSLGKIIYTIICIRLKNGKQRNFTVIMKKKKVKIISSFNFNSPSQIHFS